MSQFFFFLGMNFPFIFFFYDSGIVLYVLFYNMHMKIKQLLLSIFPCHNISLTTQSSGIY